MPNTLATWALLADLTDLKAMLDISGSGDDSQLNRLVNAASEVILDVTGREFKADDVAGNPRLYDLDDTELRRRVFAIDDCTALNQVDLINRWTDDVLQADVSVTALPLIRKRYDPIESLRLGITANLPAYGYEDLPNLGPYITARVDADWGWSAVPEKITEATLLTVESWWSKDVRRFGEVFSGQEGADPVTSVNGRALPARAWDLIHDFRRGGGVS